MSVSEEGHGEDTFQVVADCHDLVTDLRVTLASDPYSYVSVF